MSVVKQPRDWTEQERLEWIKTYQGMLDTPINSWIPEYEIEYKKKCCIACKYFEPLEERDEDGVCNELVSNDLSGQYIIGSDTFYCSLYLGTHYGL